MSYHSFYGTVAPTLYFIFGELVTLIFHLFRSKAYLQIQSIFFLDLL